MNPKGPIKPRRQIERSTALQPEKTIVDGGGLDGKPVPLESKSPQYKAFGLFHSGLRAEENPVQLPYMEVNFPGGGGGN